MTREEAIRKLEYSKKAYKMLIDEKVDSGKLVGKDIKGEWEADTPLDEVYKSMIDALEIAIKALEHPERNVVAVVPCGDAISRQAVLDINENHHGLMPNHVNHQIWKEIKALPSVTPAGKQEPCEDVISRQAVIDAMYKLCDTGETLKENPWRDNPHIDAITDAINNLPLATSQPKTGHWIYTGDYLTEGMLKCSECGEEIDVSESYYDFCPVCGAKMQEVEE